MAHSDEIKALVQAALLAGLGVNETARKYKLPKSTVSRIKTELSPERLEQGGTERKARIDDLLLNSIRTHIEAIDRIARTASEPAYIRNQEADAVAALHGKIADHAVRLLEAATNAGVEETERRERTDAVESSRPRERTDAVESSRPTGNIP